MRSPKRNGDSLSGAWRLVLSVYACNALPPARRQRRGRFDGSETPKIRRSVPSPQGRASHRSSLQDALAPSESGHLLMCKASSALTERKRTQNAGKNYKNKENWTDPFMVPSGGENRCFTFLVHGVCPRFSSLLKLPIRSRRGVFRKPFLLQERKI